MSSTRVSQAKLTPRRTARQARSQATVEAVLEAAAQVFERHGYTEGTTNRIAERAGVSIGSLYQYFPNKDAILIEVSRRHVAEGMSALAPHLQSLNEGASWTEVLPGLVDTMVAMHAVAPMLHRALFEEIRLPHAVRVELETLEDALVDLTARALAADPHVAPEDPRLAASIVVNAIEGLTHRLVLRPPPGVESSAIAREITNLVRKYLQ
jgi:AcrR family transcriptional regulator